MPRMIKQHFREIEVSIVAEYAWEPDSTIYKVIQKLKLTEQQDQSSQKMKQVMQPYNMFF